MQAQPPEANKGLGSASPHEEMQAQATDAMKQLPWRPAAIVEGYKGLGSSHSEMWLGGPQ